MTGGHMPINGCGTSTIEPYFSLFQTIGSKSFKGYGLLPCCSQQDVGLSDANPILPFAAEVAPGENSRNSNFHLLKEMAKQETTKYENRLTIRLTRAEQQQLEKLLANSAFNRNMSELLREMIFSKKLTVKTYDASLVELTEELAGIKKELRAIGVNINQVTRYFHGTHDPGEKRFYARRIATACGEVSGITGRALDLMSELGKKWSQR